MYRLPHGIPVLLHVVTPRDETLARKEAIVHVRIRGAARTKDLRKKRKV